MLKILIKEVDRLNSTVHKGKVISEFLIYLAHVENDLQNVAMAFTEYGEEAKKERVNVMLLQIMNDISVTINKEDFIEEMSLEEVLKKHNG